jgi:hypothetical protein
MTLKLLVSERYMKCSLLSEPTRPQLPGETNPAAYAAGSPVSRYANSESALHQSANVGAKSGDMRKFFLILMLIISDGSQRAVPKKCVKR